MGVIRALTKAWSLGTKRGRGGESKLGIDVRLAVMKAVAVPGLTSFCRSRT